jgi:mRNA-degrading endonuclease toxin of MazEF toxin-antitoxin module
MVDKIMTFPLSCVGKRIGELTTEDSIALDRAVMLLLGLSA